MTEGDKSLSEKIDEIMKRLENGNVGSVAGGPVNVYCLGKGTSFDIKTLLPSIDWTKLVLDNFFISIDSEPQYQVYYSNPDTVGSGYSWIYNTITMTKQYNNGIFTAYGNLSCKYNYYATAHQNQTVNHTLAVNAYLVTGRNKMYINSDHPSVYQITS